MGATEPRKSLIKNVGRTRDGYNIVELPLFMTARDIVQDHPIKFGDLGGQKLGNNEPYSGPTTHLPGADQTPAMRQELMDEKYEAASRPFKALEWGSGLRDSIHKNGYDPKEPIKIETPRKYMQPLRNEQGEEVGGKAMHEEGPKLLNGHHRLSVMFKDHLDEPIPFQVVSGGNGTGIFDQTAEHRAAKQWALNPGLEG